MKDDPTNGAEISMYLKALTSLQAVPKRDTVCSPSAPCCALKKMIEATKCVSISTSLIKSSPNV